MKEYKQDNLTIYNADCMEIMSRYEDNYFDLAVVDPPYTDDCSNMKNYLNDMRGHNYNLEALEGAPKKKYFDELMRVSKNQIVWGGNYFPYIWNFGGRCFIYWHKGNPVKNFADGEMAWTSFDENAKQFDFRYYGSLQGNTSADKKIHPTQKPKELYNWIYKNYSKEGQKILDTHLGSGSNAISAHYAKMGEFVGCELDADYYEASIKRIHQETRQLELF